MAGRQNRRRILQERCGAGALARQASQDERLALDWKTLEYHPRQKPKFPALDMAKNVEETGARVRMLLGLDGHAAAEGRQGGQFLVVKPCPICGLTAANRVPEISDSIVEIDRAMQLGFNWELGPFELWDAAGVEATVERMKKEAAPCAECQEAAGERERNPGMKTTPKTPRAGLISIW